MIPNRSKSYYDLFSVTNTVELEETTVVNEHVSTQQCFIVNGCASTDQLCESPSAARVESETTVQLQSTSDNIADFLKVCNIRLA